jgi:hypothetical protein
MQLHLIQHLARYGNVFHFVKLLTIFKCSATFNLLTMDCVFCNTLLYTMMVFNEGENGVPIAFIVMPRKLPPFGPTITITKNAK